MVKKESEREERAMRKAAKKGEIMKEGEEGKCDEGNKEEKTKKGRGEIYDEGRNRENKEKGRGG